MFTADRAIPNTPQYNRDIHKKIIFLFYLSVFLQTRKKVLVGTPCCLFTYLLSKRAVLEALSSARDFVSLLDHFTSHLSGISATKRSNRLMVLVS